MSNTKKIVNSIIEAEVKPVKVNPFTLTRPTPKTIVKQFSDPSQPNEIVELSLKSLDMAELIACSELTERYIEQYVGVDPDYRPQIVFPLVGSQKVTLSKLLFQQAVMLNIMQTGMEHPYTVEDFVALSVTMPGMWLEVTKTITDLQRVKTKND